MKNLILIITIVGLISLSCKKSEVPVSTEFSEFPSNKSLSGIRAFIKENFKAAYLSQQDSLLIIHAPHHNKNFIHIFNKYNFQPLYTLCKKGKGPNEIPNTNVCYYENENRIYWVSVGAKNSIYGYSMDQLVNSNYKNPIDTNRWPLKIGFLTDLKKIERGGKKLFSLSRNLNSEILISLINKNGEIVDSLNILNKTKYFRKTNQEYKTHAKYSYDYHPNQQKVVIAHRYSDIVMGIDFEGNTLFETKGPGDINRKPEEPVLRRKVTYIDVKIDRNYIYGLYNGKKAFDGRTYKFPRQLHVFNWNGEPVEQIQFEYRTSDFIIDKENNRIITFSPEIGDVVYYNYSFK